MTRIVFIWYRGIKEHDLHDANEGLLANATVFGSWSNGASGQDSCIAATNSACQVTISGLNANRTGSVTFSVTDVTHATLVYQSSANHDPDITDSDGTSIVILKP